MTRNEFIHNNRLRTLYPAIFLLISSGATQGVQDLDLSLHPSDIEPAITLEEHQNRTVEEYRVNGNLYMIKINPRVGAPYYLVDDTGTGDMELRRGPAGRDIKIPRWTLLTW